MIIKTLGIFKFKLLTLAWYDLHHLKRTLMTSLLKNEKKNIILNFNLTA